jgi:hypothetical protein
MGGKISKSPEHHVFEKQLAKLNSIVNGIIDTNDTFLNQNYNFLSKDICDKYQVVIEDDLSKFLKLSIESLGASIYLIPKDHESAKITKRQVCERISKHYIKILYILSLVKYVYNLEKYGDMSIAGIMFRNIRILDDIMEINFCEMPHRNYKSDGQVSFKMDFKKLEGFYFFTQYFLDPKEAREFLSVLKSVLARDNKKKLCVQKEYHKLFQCGGGDSSKIRKESPVSLEIFVNKDNPVLAKEYCFSPRKVLIKTSSKEGRKVLYLYKMFLKNYENNIATVESLLYHVVTKVTDATDAARYSLKDITKQQLDDIINQVKQAIKVFFLQSFVDYQRMLDAAKLIPNIELASTTL